MTPMQRAIALWPDFHLFALQRAAFARSGVCGGVGHHRKLWPCGSGLPCESGQRPDYHQHGYFVGVAFYEPRRMRRNGSIVKVKQYY